MDKNKGGAVAGEAPVVMNGENQNDNNGNEAGALLPVKVNAIERLPEGITVNYGGTVIIEPTEQVKAVRQFIRNKILKQYGVVGINNQTVSQLPIGLNGENVQTRLQLPKVKVDANGVFCEPMKVYHARVLPEIRKWWANSLYNTGITIADIETLD